MRLAMGTGMPRLMMKLLLKAASIAALAAAAAQADVVLDETNLVGLPSAAAPAKYSFTAATAQALTLTLADFATPAAFGSLQVAVTLGDKLVGSAMVEAATHEATVAIPAAAGDYAVNVIGTPDSTAGYGGFGVCVAPATSSCPTGGIAAYSFSGILFTPATPSTIPSSALNTSFKSTASGTYSVTITDDAFPAPLSTTTPLVGGIFLGSTQMGANLAAGTTQVTLAAGKTYTLIVAAVADANLKAGLYGIRITDPSGAAVFDRTQPVGTLPASTIVDHSTAQALSLKLSDFDYPAPLAHVGVAATEGSRALAQLTLPGALSNIPAATGSIEIWQYAVAGALPGVYQVNLTSGTASLYSATPVVNPAAASGSTAYAFAATLPSAGAYNLLVTDFQFPSALQSIAATVAQNGTVLMQSANGGFTAPAQGVVIVVVDAQPPPSGSGIFDVTVQTSGASPQILLDQTQVVGGQFTTQTVNLGTSGAYSAALTDLAFPATFKELATVISKGATVLGKVYGSGTFQLSGTPGQYLVTTVATPGSQNYGLYSLRLASSVPTVSLAASPSTVTAGATSTLTWSSTNANACTASGGAGWTGSQATSGTLAVVVSAAETLMLTCTGPGGSATQSVTVTATPAPSGGGGGSLNFGLLAALAALALARRRPVHGSG